MDRRIENEIFPYLPEEILMILPGIDSDVWRTAEEIRLRAGRRTVIEGKRRIILNYLPSGDMLRRVLMKICENSIYAYQEDIRNGFITLRGGHRVGMVGRAVAENNEVKYLKDISGINIRISRQVKGCAGGILPELLAAGGIICSTLIIAPPKCGKTTVLRDLSRMLSDGEGCKPVKVGIVDERSEIAACFRGTAQNDVGANTDVLDCCPKRQGMEMLLRSMSPEVIIIDEIGNKGDSDAVRMVMNAGVKIVATAHGYRAEDMMCKEEVWQLIKAGVFEKVAVIDKRSGSDLNVSVKDMREEFR